MASTIDNFMKRRQAMYDEPMQVPVLGATSDDISKYLPLATGALTEVVSDELKKKEQGDAARAAAASPAGQAQKAAQDAAQKAAFANADALTETDPNGPKHKAAAQAQLDLAAAQAKANFFLTQAASTGAAPLPPGVNSLARGTQSSSMFTTKNLMIAGGVVLAGAVGYKLFFSKKG